MAEIGDQKIGGTFVLKNVSEDGSTMTWLHNNDTFVKSGSRFLTDAFKTGKVEGADTVKGDFWLVDNVLQMNPPKGHDCINVIEEAISKYGARSDLVRNHVSEVYGISHKKANQLLKNQVDKGCLARIAFKTHSWYTIDTTRPLCDIVND